MGGRNWQKRKQRGNKMALTLTQATTITTRLQQQASTQGLPVDKYIFSMSMIPIEKRQQLYSQYQEAVKMIQPVPGVTTSIDTSRASIASELPPATGAERFTPIVSKDKAGTDTASSGPSITPSETKPKITISITAVELQTIADAKAKGLCVGAMKSYYTVKTYNIGTRDGQKIKVEALDVKGARAKAEAAGYKVSSITKSLGLSASVKPTAPATVEVRDEMGGTVLIPEDQFNALPEKYRNIALTTGWRAMDTAMYRDRVTFEQNNVALADGQYMAKSDFSNLQTYDAKYGTNYSAIAQSQGFNAVQSAITADAVAVDSAIGKLTPYKTGDGYNLFTARANGVSPTDMILAGFDQKDVQGVEDAYQTSIRTGTALPGDRKWINSKTGYVVSDAKLNEMVQKWQDKLDILIKERKTLNQILSQAGPDPRTNFQLTPESQKRLTIEGVSMFVFSPARALLPEVQLKDISKLEWAVGGAQLATLAMPIIPKGTVPLVSAGATAIFGYSTAKSWNQLRTPEKVLGVLMTGLVATPAISAATKLTSAKLAGARANMENVFIKAVRSEIKLPVPKGKAPTTLEVATGKLQRIVEATKGTPLEGRVQTNINKLTTAMFRGDVQGVRNAGMSLENLIGKKPRASPKGTTAEQMVKDGGSYVKTKAPDLVRSVEYRVIADDIASSSTWREARVKLNDYLDLLEGEKIAKQEKPMETLSDYLSEAMYRSPGTSEGTGHVGLKGPEVMSWEQAARLRKVQDRLQRLIDSTLSPLEKDSLYRALQSRSPEVRQMALNDLWDTLEKSHGAKYLQEYLQVDDLTQFAGIEEAAEAAATQDVDDIIAEVKRILKDNKNRSPDAPLPSDIEPLRPPERGAGGGKIQVAVKEKTQVRPRTEQLTETERAALAKAKTKYGLEQMTKEELKALQRAKQKIDLAKERAKRAIEALEKQEAEILNPTQKARILAEQYQVLGIPLAAAFLPKGVKPEIVARPTTKVATVTRPGVAAKPATQPQVTTQPQVVTAPQPSTRVQTKTRLQVKMQPQVKPQVRPAVKVQLWPRPITQTETKPALKIPTPIVVKQGEYLRRVRPLGIETKRPKIHEGPALAVWKQGAYWVSIFPPFRTTGRKEDVVYSRDKPPWGSVIARGRHAPKRTLRSMGHVPELITVPMGVVTARIRGGRHLSFSRSNGRRRGRVLTR